MKPRCGCPPRESANCVSHRHRGVLSGASLDELVELIATCLSLRQRSLVELAFAGAGMWSSARQFECSAPGRNTSIACDFLLAGRLDAFLVLRPMIIACGGWIVPEPSVPVNAGRWIALVFVCSEPIGHACNVVGHHPRGTRRGTFGWRSWPCIHRILAAGFKQIATPGLRLAFAVPVG